MGLEVRGDLKEYKAGRDERLGGQGQVRVVGGGKTRWARQQVCVGYHSTRDSIEWMQVVFQAGVAPGFGGGSSLGAAATVADDISSG